MYPTYASRQAKTWSHGYPALWGRIRIIQIDEHFVQIFCFKTWKIFAFHLCLRKINIQWMPMDGIINWCLLAFPDFQLELLNCLSGWSGCVCIYEKHSHKCLHWLLLFTLVYSQIVFITLRINKLFISRTFLILSFGYIPIYNTGWAHKSYSLYEPLFSLFLLVEHFVQFGIPIGKLACSLEMVICVLHQNPPMYKIE